MGFPAGKSACRDAIWVKPGHEWSDRADGPACCTDGTATITASEENVFLCDKIVSKSKKIKHLEKQLVN